jgi:hypothetical protein
VESVGAVVALTDDLHALLLEQIAQARPKQVVVVDEQDARLRRLRIVGVVGQLGLTGDGEV